MKTLVLGLGNPILTDDGVGVRVAQEVRAHLPEDSQVEVSEVSVGGLTLMENMIGYEKVILIDAFQGEGRQPGEFQRMDFSTLQELSPTQHSASPHDASLVTAVEAGRCLGYPLPAEITIFAVQVENILDFSEEPTPAVAAAIPAVTAAVLGEIRQSW
jgi:hydrogenase maturation protease